jgi:c-di-AMP phosphodiesterase-like protein
MPDNESGFTFIQRYSMDRWLIFLGKEELTELVKDIALLAFFICLSLFQRQIRSMHRLSLFILDPLIFCYQI